MDKSLKSKISPLKAETESKPTTEYLFAVAAKSRHLVAENWQAMYDFINTPNASFRSTESDSCQTKKS